ncbi:MAG: GNAT family N-acetyltransferase, partial [Cyanobacteria bacterium J06638_6]
MTEPQPQCTIKHRVDFEPTFKFVGYLSCQSPSQDDIADLVALDQRALGGLWSAEGYKREIDSPNSCLLMLVHRPFDREGNESSSSTSARDGANRSLGLGPAVGGISDGDREGNLLGLGCYWAILDEAHITVLAVDPRYQRRGLGQWLLTNLLIDACDGQGLAREDNDALT